MRKPAFGLAALFILLASAASAGPLDSYRQKARPVVVFGEEDNPDFRQQIEIFNRASMGFRERDIVLIPVSTRGGKQDLRALFRVEAEDFQVLVIGKDGGVKLRRRGIVSPEEIFRLVDSMPMRRLEAPAGRDAGIRRAP
jgi:hypothetical protein